MDYMDEMMNSLYFIKASTYAGAFSLMAFFDDEIEGLRSFQGWVKEYNLKPEMLWYSDVFTAPEGKHVGSIELRPDRSVALLPAPEGSKLNPFKKRHQNKILKAICGQ